MQREQAAMKLIRRDFFRTLTVTLGSIGLFGRKGRIYALSHAAENRGKLAPGCTFFNVSQARTLETICDQIVPPDNEYPGGKDAGVLYYIDNALTKWLPENRWDYVAGLDGVDESSQLMFGKNFVDLNWEQQTKVLEEMEKGEAPGQVWRRLTIGPESENSSRNFFNLLLGHAMQGYYGHPRYGGNKDKRSWKMIGYNPMFQP
jgi:gluconate 2-dehydrogenase gamma chain